MARRRGFIAEMQHQARLAEQRQRAVAREHAAAARRAEQARKAEIRAAEQLRRTNEAERKQLEKEARNAHVEAQQAEVDALNEALAETYNEIDSLLPATLDLDDFVDLESFRQTPVHPEFGHLNLQRPVPSPEPLLDPEPPVFVPPATPTGLFGRKKKLAEATAIAEEEFAKEHAAWEKEMENLPAQRKRIAARHALLEETRIRELSLARKKYENECAAREEAVIAHNASLDEFIANLSYGVPEAVEEYIGIVLGNSSYPEWFTVTHDVSFAPESAEFSLRVLIPGPDSIPTIKTYRYVKASDEITTTALSQKDTKDRYANAIHQIALRSLHEILESDRRELVQSVSLELGTATISPATGNETYVPFCAVAVSREIFESFDLSAVTPLATLEFLGAALSKNPWALTPINASGVRRS